MTDHKELPPDIAEAEAELRPVYDAAKRKAPAHLRSRVLAAVKAAETEQQAADTHAESDAPPSDAGMYGRPITKWKAFALAAALVVSFVGLIRKADPWLELRRVAAEEVAYAGHLAYGDDAARALSGSGSSSGDARHNFYPLLPQSVMVVEPSLAEGEAALPACEAKIVVELMPDGTGPSISADSLAEVLPDYLRADLLELASGAKSVRLAHKIEPFTYQFRMASDSAEACGVEKVFVVQIDLSKVGLAAVPMEFVTDFTGTSHLNISTRLDK